MPVETIILRLLLSCVIGGVIGAEREYLNKSAGLRTMILISLGSCVFTIFSSFLSNSTPDRIASNIVTGIGFLGAGVIFKEDNRVKGLTTAASIWVTAALGMGVAGGYYLISSIGAVLALLTLQFLTLVEEFLDRINQTRDYRIMAEFDPEHLYRYEELFRKHHLKFSRIKQTKSDQHITGSWNVRGREKNHQSFIDEILKDSTVKEFDF